MSCHNPSVGLASIIESKIPLLEVDKILQVENLIQIGNFSINQEYVLVDNLEEGIYPFKGQFIFQVCNDKNCLQYIYDRAPTFRVNKDSNSYNIHWEGESPFKANNVDEINFIDEEDEQSLIMSFFVFISVLPNSYLTL